jgi:hypothetical protein
MGAPRLQFLAPVHMNDEILETVHATATIEDATSGIRISIVIRPQACFRDCR